MTKRETARRELEALLSDALVRGQLRARRAEESALPRSNVTLLRKIEKALTRGAV